MLLSFFGIQVVDTTLRLIHESGHDNKQLFFIEPSCGDGKILLELLKSQSPVLNNARIVGYDIDSSAIDRSIQNFSGLELSANVKYTPTVRCSNFLTVSRQNLLQDLNASDESNCVGVVLGGPPYTPKDLPGQFILHSIQKLHAEIVVFILPARCEKDAVRIQEILNRDAEDGKRWQFVNEELANINFDFEGSSVIQPSILQYWYLDETS